VLQQVAASVQGNAFIAESCDALVQPFVHEAASAVRLRCLQGPEIRSAHKIKHTVKSCIRPVTKAWNVVGWVQEPIYTETCSSIREGKENEGLLYSRGYNHDSAPVTTYARLIVRIIAGTAKGNASFNIRPMPRRAARHLTCPSHHRPSPTHYLY
jgi:hypothetical protein